MNTRKLFLAVLIAVTALTLGGTGCKKRDAKPAPQVAPAPASFAGRGSLVGGPGTASATRASVGSGTP